MDLTKEAFHKMHTIKYIVALIFSFSTFYGFGYTEYNGFTITPDSIGEEIIDNKVFILHKVEAKDTYYKLSRQYGATVNQIMSANNKKNLRIGDTVKIPTMRQASQQPQNVAMEQNQQPGLESPSDPTELLTEYKVGKKETLYAISRRFDISVEDLKEYNDLRSDRLKEGQILKIPTGPLPHPSPVEENERIIDIPANELEVDEIKTNKYGIREKRERGIGVWIEGLASDGKSNLALHNTAPVGTILKITNPMTKNVTYAKVVGRFSENADTRGAVVVLSKSAASYIGALDRRFQIELTYGLPLEF